MTTEEEQSLIPREPTVKPSREERIREFRLKTSIMLKRRVQMWAYQHMSTVQDKDLIVIRDKGVENGNIKWGEIIEEYRQARIQKNK